MESRLLPGLRAYWLAVFGRGNRQACVCFFFLRFFQRFQPLGMYVCFATISFIIVGSSAVFFSVLLFISLLLTSLLFSTLIYIELRDWPPAPATRPARTPSDFRLCVELPSDSRSSFSSDPLFDLVAITLFGTLSPRSFVGRFRRLPVPPPLHAPARPLDPIPTSARSLAAAADPPSTATCPRPSSPPLSPHSSQDHFHSR